jgi:predicted kinase
MVKVFFLKGLPASGKTTWALDRLKCFPNHYKRINKDSLREMLDGNHFSSNTEKFILKVRDALILMAIAEGKHVIVDDTNLHPKHEQNIRELVKGKAEFEVIKFNESVEVCIKRDLKRVNSVGETVIKKMYKDFIEVKEEYKEDPNLPHAIIVDIDGTLAHSNGRSPYDWGRVGEDSCDEAVKSLIDNYNGNTIIVSGRDAVCIDATRAWLNKNKVNDLLMWMRPQGNNEKDCVIKRRIFEEHIRGKYYIDFVLDDRNQVVEMWRSLGLKVLQVAEGDF